MIKHGSSLFISLMLHTLLFFLLFYSWKNIPIFHEKENEKKLCVKLCCVMEEKIEQNLKKIDIPAQQEKIVKNEIKKVTPKKVANVKEKKIITPIVKDKVVPKIEKVENIEKVQEVEKEFTEKENLEAFSYKVVQKEAVPTEEIQTKEIRVQKEYINDNIQKIVKLLSDNLYYPRSARERGIAGEVLVKFKLSTEAAATSIEIVTSHSDILSRAAIKTIEDLSGKFPKPAEELVLEVPINYNLK